MKDARREYELALADFAKPSARWQTKGRLTYWGKAAGLTADEIIIDARAVGVTDRDADIRRGWNDAKPKGDRPQGDWRRNAPRVKPKPLPTFPHFVRDMVQAGGGEATSADLLALSPLPIPHNGWLQTVQFLIRLFHADDKLFVFEGEDAGKPGTNILTRQEWADAVMRRKMLPGDKITPNPLTGEQGLTTEGKPSFIAKSCLVCFPYLLIEFDGMPLQKQASFWRGFVTSSPLGAKVAAITFSGGKSLHGLLHVGCETLAEWERTRDQLRGLLAADPEAAFRVDEQSLQPRQGTRLPGVRRFGSGKVQRLLYLNPEAVQRLSQEDAEAIRLWPRECPFTRDAATADNDATEAVQRATNDSRSLPAHAAAGGGVVGPPAATPSTEPPNARGARILSPNGLTTSQEASWQNQNHPQQKTTGFFTQ